MQGCEPWKPGRLMSVTRCWAASAGSTGSKAWRSASSESSTTRSRPSPAFWPVRTAVSEPWPAVSCSNCIGTSPSRSVPFAPEAERFLRRPVGYREQHGLLIGAVRIRLPSRHHEHVARSPFDGLPIHLGRALAFQAREDGAVGRAVALALEALGQQREI